MGGHAANDHGRNQTRVAAIKTVPAWYAPYPLCHRAAPYIANILPRSYLFIYYSLLTKSKVQVEADREPTVQTVVPKPPYLHPGRCRRPAGVHRLDVARLGAPHHEAPAHRVPDNLWEARGGEIINTAV